jgi:hypothetical protein
MTDPPPEAAASTQPASQNDCPWCQREPAAADGGPGKTCAAWRQRAEARDGLGVEWSGPQN